MQTFVPVEALFKGRHFDGQIIILCVSRYTSSKLSLRDLVIMMADPGGSTSIKVGGRWVYLYRAVGKVGGTVDFFLSRNRDVNAAKAFFRRAVKNTRQPTKIHIGRLCGIASRGAGNEGDGRTSNRVRVRFAA